MGGQIIIDKMKISQILKSSYSGPAEQVKQLLHQIQRVTKGNFFSDFVNIKGKKVLLHLEKTRSAAPARI